MKVKSLLEEKKWRPFLNQKNQLLTYVKNNPTCIGEKDLWVLNLMSGPQRGGFMQKWHMARYASLVRRVAAKKQKGDFVAFNGTHYEYKFSLVGEGRKASFLQIRLFHPVDYILEIYDDMEKRFYCFLVPHAAMEELIHTTGCLIHGVEENVHNFKLYALRPDFKEGRKGYPLWQRLKNDYLISSASLRRAYKEGAS